MTIVCVVYVAAGVVYTWPLVLQPGSSLAAPVGPGDTFLNLWILGWGLGTAVSAPLDLINGRAFNANIFYPAESALAFSDHMLLQSAALAPLYALTHDAVLCYNVLLFLSLVLSGIAMHAFVRTTVGSTGAAYLAGLAWAFWPYRFAHLVHIQIQCLYFLPLTFLFLHRLMAGRRVRDAVGLGVMVGLQALSSVYYAIIGGVGLVVAAVALAVGIGRWRSAVIARRLMLAAVIGAVLVAPVAWVYLRVQHDEGFGRSIYEASRNAAVVGSYAQVTGENVAYGRTGVLATGLLEHALFPGFVVLGLAAFGIVCGWRGHARPLVLAMVSLAVVGFVLSLGPEGFRTLYAWLQRSMFGFQAIRAPARFAVLVMFALATLASLGFRELRWKGAKMALFALAAIELLSVPMPLTPAPPRQTQVGQWLRREPGTGAVVYLPMAVDIASTPAMVQSLEHRRPLLNGYSGQRPEFYNALVDSVSNFPSDDALLALKETGVRFVVSASPIDPPASGSPWPLLERARFADGVIYELHWTPEIDARLTADAAVVPPAPGPPPFRPGETARYSAFWAGGGMSVSAGEITVSVQSPLYTLVARGETAPWMARFSEVNATFTTRTDAELVPRVHERDERQGSRHVARTFLYAHPEHVIRIGRDAEHAAGADGMSLPLAAAARDALSAVFYARTLPLANDDRYLIPINEAGRSLTVELVVAGRETISVQGHDTAAIRLDPRIRRRADRRRPITAVLWLSDDERRVPLAMDLDAPFGRVRLELVSYQRQ